MIVSGFAHQRHFKGHPLKNTVVRIPGPSWVANFRISDINPVLSIFKLALSKVLYPFRDRMVSGLSKYQLGRHILCHDPNLRFRDSLGQESLDKHPPSGHRRIPGLASVRYQNEMICFLFGNQLENQLE